MKFRRLPGSTAVFGARRQRWAYLLAAVAVALAGACGETSETTSFDADLGEEPVVTLEQQPGAASAEESSESAASTELDGPKFATSFSTPAESKERGDLKIATLLPRDAIPSIDSPKFIDVESANDQMGDDDLIIGVAIDGEHKAYSTAFLSSHEIVNDVIGGKPVAVTW